MDQWYKIDNTGKIFHAVSSATNSSVFRVSMILKETIEPDCLQKALDIVAIRFPTLTVRVRKGVFWDFMEYNDAPLHVKKESDYPCAPIDTKSNNAYLIRVLYFDRRISVEIFHSLTDGGGAVEFLKTLVYQYLILKGESVAAEGAVLLPEDPPNKEEIEDSFERYSTGRSEKRSGSRGEKAFQIKGTAFNPLGINVIHGVVDASGLNAFAKRHGTSLTGFLMSVLIHVIHTEKMTRGKSEEKVAIALPISLRRQFPSMTLRNFFSVANIGAHVDDHVTFDDIIKEVTGQLKERTDKEALQANINRFVSLQSSLWTRLTPVVLKYPAMRLGFNQFGERAKTMTLSNLGNVKMPESMAPHIERMDVVLYPTRNSPINCGLVTLNDQLTITFARSIEENDIITAFFRELRRLTGFEIAIYSNDWGEET
ncbi:alcohol acetyltransferase [Salinicoccus hispanicus]|uniref:Alcohol acetyltransferase n=1 Tax=Salinicoccus hispanicus TaxID=157225 RepID=A0A6N8U4F9_9STAP|nr:alcohol acetyltransferase [Salinicoccus hispanicus]MXQ52006.1 alcohol acetyltransferase [Salinicoccus hispanicus]